MKPQQQLKIIKRGWGIADRFPDGTIEINRNLDDYPQIKKSIIQHEARHTNREGFTKEDMIHDLSTIDQFSQWDMVKFITKNPLSLIQFLPIYYHFKRKEWIMDINLLVIYSIVFPLFAIAIFIGMRV